MIWSNVYGMSRARLAPPGSGAARVGLRAHYQTLYLRHSAGAHRAAGNYITEWTHKCDISSAASVSLSAISLAVDNRDEDGWATSERGRERKKERWEENRKERTIRRGARSTHSLTSARRPAEGHSLREGHSLSGRYIAVT